MRGAKADLECFDTYVSIEPQGDDCKLNAKLLYLLQLLLLRHLGLLGVWVPDYIRNFNSVLCVFMITLEDEFFPLPSDSEYEKQLSSI